MAGIQEGSGWFYILKLVLSIRPVLARRKPMLLLRLSGVLLFHDPPRRTRLEPFTKCQGINI